MRKKNWVWVLVVMAALFALCFAGCGGAKGTQPPALSEANMSFALTGSVDYSYLVGDREACLGIVRQACTANQEVLVATMTAFPQTLHDYGIELEDPQELDWQLDFAKDGAKTRDALLEALEEVLSDESVAVEFGSWQGYGSALYVFVRDRDAGAGSENCGLMPVPICLDGHPIMVIARSYANGSQDIGYFDLYTGFQRILPQEAISYG